MRKECLWPFFLFLFTSLFLSHHTVYCMCVSSPSLENIMHNAGQNCYGSWIHHLFRLEKEDTRTGNRSQRKVQDEKKKKKMDRMSWSHGKSIRKSGSISSISSSTGLLSCTRSFNRLQLLLSPFVIRKNRHNTQQPVFSQSNCCKSRELSKFGTCLRILSRRRREKKGGSNG